MSSLDTNTSITDRNTHDRRPSLRPIPYTCRRATGRGRGALLRCHSYNSVALLQHVAGLLPFGHYLGPSHSKPHSFDHPTKVLLWYSTLSHADLSMDGSRDSQFCIEFDLCHCNSSSSRATRTGGTLLC
jgi:hypothetical protein